MTWMIPSFVVLTLTSLSPAFGGDDRQKTPDLFDEAKTLSTHEDWDEAIARFRDFLARSPNDLRTSEAQFWIGFCLVKLDEFEEALRELAPFQGKLAEDKWADDALLQLGLAYQGDGQNERALQTWKRLLEKYPDSVWRTEAATEIIDASSTPPRSLRRACRFAERVVLETADLDAIAESALYRPVFFECTWP